MKNKIVEIHLNNWKEIFTLNEHLLSAFIFRGQSDSSWDLSTSLERMLGKYDLELFMLANKEYWMLHEFKRKIELYSNNIPDKDDNFEWLAIMQHYGTPTRLLDFTHSIFLATFFATSETSTDSAIWGVNYWMLRERIKERFNLDYEKGEILRDQINIHHIELANKYIGVERKSRTNYLIPLEPKKASKRLSQQQGLFLMPVNGEESFMKNLSTAFGMKKSVLDFEKISLREFSKTDPFNHNISIIKMIIPRKNISSINKTLAQMNITSELIYPGLEGLAKSLIQSEIID